MKAAVLRDFDRPLTIEDVPMPEPGPGQVVVRVAACGVCHSDVHMARGEWVGFKSLMPLPLILGHEVAGTVERRGPDVIRLREGDRVGIPWFHHTCGECTYCKTDREVFCDKSAITGGTVDGGFAEYVLAWESHVVSIPESVPLAEAAPLFCAGGTVFSALSKVSLDDTKRVAIWGAGGLGLYAIQLARLTGAHVTAVDLLDTKFPLASEMGAESCVRVAESAEWFADPEHQVDVVLVSATSAEAYRSATGSVRKDATLLVVGIPSDPLEWTAGKIVQSGLRIVGSRVCSRRELRELMALAADGAIRSEIHPYRLDQAEETLELVARGQIEGRAVLDLTE